ncbi:S8 family peptidase [Rhodoferax sp. AJA081-3]|uniref:S8 family peptidase n=1 Tax=Rhodoferax sp. AJA081-3 TaxID=2752316 RepID=UPI001FD764DA|nr:S8 family peptidase [Rhodoferax sp. AJA081-3]
MTPTRLRFTSLAALMLLGLSTSAFAQSRSTYIVQLAAEPVASYTGTVPGYSATLPAPGTRLNTRSSAALAYKAYLDAQQTTVASLIAGAPIVARYSTVYNGFAARLTAAEVQALRTSPLVVEVFADEARKLNTISTPAFLGLSTAGGVWSQTVAGLALKGEDIIIGVVDSGIWPENPSFADRVNGSTPVFGTGTLAYGPAPAGWNGSCMGGEGFTPATHCNNKLIGAQYFNAGFLSSGLPKHWTEFYSPRDSVAGPTGHGGHGSHTASTAGGNSGAPVTLGGNSVGTASGIAPRARLAAYKVCYTYVNPNAEDGTGSQNSCFTSDSVAAIDKAVADGVHVINYSISGSQTSVNDPVEQAFLRAANAGVFVAASAGNSGPAVAVAHVSPWLTTVAASTHDRALSANVTLGNGASYTGASFNAAALAAKPVIRAEDAGLPGADATQLRLCYLTPAVLDPVKVAGKVVVCTRGVTARTDKSAAVKAAGGVGMVLADNGAGLVADVHSVPSVHVNAADGAAIKTYAQAGGGTAAIGTYFNAGKPAPIMAGFSSRGPNAGDANMLKPDLTAPGVDIIAAVTAGLTNAERDAVANGTLVPVAEWSSYQGTSMSSPHVAGLAALIRQMRPTWSPAAIKSALMTTSMSTLNDGLADPQNGLLPWAQGAGHVVPTKALDPGLVYDNGKVEFIRYQCNVNKPAVTPASDCVTYGTLDQTYNFNLPSITVGAVVGSTVVTRKVTNVGASAATYTATASVPGFTTVVTPSSMTLAAGETKTFTVTLTAAGVADGQWSFGSLVWSDGAHVVRSPVTARTGKTIQAPASLTATTASGSRLITLTTNFNGRPAANKGGMKAVTVGPLAGLVPGAPSSAALKAACVAGVDTASIKVYPFVLPADTIVARFETRNADVGSAGDDNDLIIVSPTGASVYSGNDGSNEAVQLVSPTAGTYKVCVGAYAGAANMTHRLSSWVVTAADASSSLNVLLPSTVYSGSTATAGLAWSGLAAGGRFVGGVQFKDAGGSVQATTILRVNTDGTAPLAFTEKTVSTDKLRQ